MNPENSANLQAALELADAALSAQATEIAAMPPGEERSRRVRSIATLLVGSPAAHRAQAIRLCPDIESAVPVPDTQLNPAELEIAARLSEADIALMDRTLVATATLAWQSVARVVGYTLVDLKTMLPDIPLGFYAQRVAALAHCGALLGRGDLGFIRLSEVKLPAPGNTAG